MTNRPSIRGRGAAHDPPNRFEPIEVDREEWVLAEDPDPETRLYRDASRSIAATNDSPDVGFEASVNPYRGCECGCSYCVGPETPILMGDGSLRAIADLQVGDEIYGTVRRRWLREFVKTTVLAHWETWKPAYRITLGDGTELVASGDHRFLTLRGWKHVTGAEQGRNRRPHLTLNDRMLGIGGFSRTTLKKDSDYRTGYLCGMIRGDGHLSSYEYSYPHRSRRLDRQYQFRLALIDPPALDRSARHLSRFGVETHRREFKTSGWARKPAEMIGTHARGHFRRIESLVEYPTRPSRSWRRGFLAGIFDAEGSYSCGVMRISNTDCRIIEEVARALRGEGFDAVVESRRRESDRNRTVVVVRVRGGLQEHLRFFHTTDPVIYRKRTFVGQSVKSAADLSVSSIEPIGWQSLFDVTTGTGDFIANGAVSHNCYARPFHEYLGLSAGLDFETKVFVKEDAPALLRRKLSSPKWEPKVLAMSGVTDPYQPAESRLGITRGCLEVLAEFRNPVAIITKRQTVTRDADLLGELARHRAAVVNLSITSLDRDLQRVMEPRASIPEKRLEAIRTLSEAGIPTGVMVAPVVPGLTDHEMPAILEAAAEAGAVRAAFIVLRLPHGVKELFADWLERHFPDRREKVLNRLRSLRGGDLYDATYGSRMRGEGPYAEQIRAMFEVGCRKAGLNEVAVELSTAAFRRPGEGRQLGLFEAASGGAA